MASERGSKSEASPRVFRTEFKVDLIARLERGEAAARVARESGVARKLLHEWLKAYRAHGAAGSTAGAVARSVASAKPATNFWLLKEGLVDHERIAVEGIVGIALNPPLLGIDLQEPVDRLGLNAGRFGHTLGCTACWCTKQTLAAHVEALEPRTG